MDDTIRCEAEASSTVDFVDPTPVMNSTDWLARQEFIQGATWSLKRLAAWLEVTNIVSDDEGAQRAVNETKSLIAAQARQAAAELKCKTDSR